MKKIFFLSFLMVGFFLPVFASAAEQGYNTFSTSSPTSSVDWNVMDERVPLVGKAICQGRKFFGTYPDASVPASPGNDFGNYPTCSFDYTPWAAFNNDSLEVNYQGSVHGNGDYWQMITLDNGEQYYFLYHRNGAYDWTINAVENIEFDPSDFPSGIGITTVITPLQGSTTTSPVSWNFSVYASSSDPTQLPDGYRIVAIERSTGVQKIFLGLLPSYTPGLEFTVSTSTPISPDGSYGYVIRLLNNAQAYLANPGGVTQSIVGSSYQGYFGVNFHTQVPFDTYSYTGPTETAASCNVNFLGDDFSLSGCISYLVSPSVTTMQNFGALNLQQRFPFAYAFDIADLRNDLFNSPHTGSTSLSVDVENFGVITFISTAMIAAVPFAGTIKIILGALIYLMMAEYIYKLVLRSHNQNTGV